MNGLQANTVILDDKLQDKAALTEDELHKPDTRQAVAQRMAEFKRQLRAMSKSDLVRSYCAQYAQTVQYSVKLEKAQNQIELLNEKLKALEPKESENV